MYVGFYTYQGTAGDLQEIIVCENRAGRKWYGPLVPYRGWSRRWLLRRAKKKMLAQVQKDTGQVPIVDPWFYKPKLPLFDSSDRTGCEPSIERRP